MGKSGLVSPPQQDIIHPGLSGFRSQADLELGCFSTGLEEKLSRQAAEVHQTRCRSSGQAVVTNQQD